MAVLGEAGVERVFHYTPLHYLPFIGRSQSLQNKPSLKAAGFAANHLRSMSNAQDVARGFGDYAHLTLEQHPRILRAKLSAGFPHVEIAVPTEAVDTSPFSLCRFNVAMTRQLRRDGKSGFPKSATNGRYYPGHEIPIARTDEDKRAMLDAHLANSMIEVLVHGDLDLPEATHIRTFSAADTRAAKDILDRVGVPWTVIETDPPSEYPRSAAYAKQVDVFIERALADPTWRGDGLEFDRV